MLSRRLPLARSASAQAGDGAASPVKHRDGRSNIAVLGGFCCRGYGVGHGLLRPQSVERVRSRSIALRRSATATHSVKRRFRVGSRPSKRSRLIIKFLCDGFAKIMEMDRSNAPARCATRDGEQSQGDSAQRASESSSSAARFFVRRSAAEFEHFLHTLHCELASEYGRIAETRAFSACHRGSAVAPSSGMTRRRKNPHAIALGRLGGLKGGHARAAKLSARRRASIARHAAAVRWGRTS